MVTHEVPAQFRGSWASQSSKCTNLPPNQWRLLLRLGLFSNVNRSLFGNVSISGRLNSWVQVQPISAPTAGWVWLLGAVCEGFQDRLCAGRCWAWLILPVLGQTAWRILEGCASPPLQIQWRQHGPWSEGPAFKWGLGHSKWMSWGKSFCFSTTQLHFYKWK